MSARSPVGRAKQRAVEQVIAATRGRRLVLDRGAYGMLAARGISRREVDRALDALAEQGRILVYSDGPHVFARLLDGGER